MVTLIDNLRASMPLSLATVQRRLALEEVGNCLTDRCVCVLTGVWVNGMSVWDNVGRWPQCSAAWRQRKWATASSTGACV